MISLPTSKLLCRIFCACACLWLSIALRAATPTVTIDVDKPGHAISPTLWGLFFEDINNSADGGIYPELIRNISFEDAETAENWKLVQTGEGSKMAIDTSKPLNPYNRRSLRVNLAKSVEIENAGYWGMNIESGQQYRFRLAARAEQGFTGPLGVTLLSAKGVELAKGSIANIGAEWRYESLDLTASASDPKARLRISAQGSGVLYLDMVSLLPAKTWKNHGLRQDLAESLDALKPAFVRFPGGCWVEGDDMAHMNHWKNTVGNLDTRIPLWNIWGYNATHGLGLFEYFQMTEDLGATPLFCINVGMSHKEVVPMDKMDQWVQDALDVIEYANGPVDSVWGARRAAAGHPAPFNLKYLEIGNENGGEAYRERWPLFYRAIKAKHPEMHLITNTFWVGELYPKNPKPEIIDEHYYESAVSFMQRASMYDSYDRNGPKVFVGEYAVTKGCGKGNLRAAIGEAAFMTGMERNSDVVIMASYAPLLVNLNHRAWNPDLINFDSERWYGLPGYYVQQLFAQNRGDVVLPVKVDAPEIDTSSQSTNSGYAGVGTWATQAEYKDLMVTDAGGKLLYAADLGKGTKDFKLLGEGNWSVENGALQQKSEATFVRALVGDKTWKDYTVSVKARKLGGNEGFMVLFHVQNEEDKTLWNIGGWGNTASALEFEGTFSDRKDLRVETGRWYDLRVEVKGANVKCFLDGKLMHESSSAVGSKVKSLYACASRDDKTGDVIVKVVNAMTTALETDLVLQGVGKISGSVKATLLTSENGTDENSLETPLKVAPKQETLQVKDSTLHHAFPGNSLTVLRISR